MPGLGALWLIAAAAVLWLPAGEASAQAGSPACRALQAQLAAVGSGGANPRYARAAARQRAEIANSARQYQAAGCGGFFQSGQCGALDARLRQMRANLAQLEAQAGGGGASAQRARLLAALDANGCRGGQVAARPAPRDDYITDEGPERQIYRRIRTPDMAGRPQTAYRVDTAPPSGFGGFIERLFGARPTPHIDEPGEVQPIPEERLRSPGGEERPRGVGYRAVCVRLCDGAFFPMTSSPRPGVHIDQEEMCQLQCPGAAVALYRMRDDLIENAVSTSGAPYTALPNALRFRQRFDPACTCRPSGGSWAEAFAHRQDPTLRSGDQVVSAEQARLLSLPAAQRQAVREQIAAEQRALREAERQARADRLRSRDGAPAPTIGLDGEVRLPADPDPADIRTGSPEPSGAPAEAEADRRPVRIILPAPRAEAPAQPSGG